MSVVRISAGHAPHADLDAFLADAARARPEALAGLVERHLNRSPPREHVTPWNADKPPENMAEKREAERKQAREKRDAERAARAARQPPEEPGVPGQ